MSSEAEPPEPRGSQQQRRPRLWRDPLFWAIVLCAVSGFFFLHSVSRGWHDEIGGLHAFRQTQTAITCFYMVRQPFKLAYETPVLGPPWSIPMELPVYQWIVSAIVAAFGVPLPQTGRAVGVSFYVAALVPVYWLLGSLRVAINHRLIFIAILLLSPFYIFWSRTFMIETTALCLCVAYLALVARYLERRSRHLLVLAIIFGCLGSLLKITTFITFGLAAVLLHVSRCWEWPIRWRAMAGSIVVASLTVGVPFLAAIWWAHCADAVKEQNVLGRYLTSAYLSHWYFGSIQQRLSADTWRVILGRAPSLITYDKGFWLACALAFVVTRRRWKEATICVLLFLSSPLIFTNLHYVHDYYMCANGLFLLAAVGFCLVGILEMPGGQKAGFAAVALTMALAVGDYKLHYAPLQRENRRARSTNAPKETLATTDPQSVTIYLGMDWDPQWPYFGERRALMIPEWQFVTDDDVRRALAQLRGYQIGAVVARPNSRYPLQSLLNHMQELGLDTSKVHRLP